MKKTTRAKVAKSTTKKVIDKIRAAAPKPAPPKPKPARSLIVEPSKDALKAAAAAKRAARSDGRDDLPPCHVIGLDYSKWASAIVDLDVGPGKIAAARRAMTRKGYVKLEGEVVVVGFDNAEAWVKSRKDYLADREARKERIADAIARGTMSDSAAAPMLVRGRGGVRTA